MSHVPELSSKHEILIVDPDSSFIEILSSHLTQRGYTVHTASNPKEGLELVKKGSIGFVISELELPDYSGWVFSSNVRETKLKNPPEVLLVSEESLVNLEMAHKVGACTMLGKPIQIDALIDSMEHYAKQSLQDRRYERVEVDPKVHGPMTGNLTTAKGSTQTFEVSNIGRGGFYMELPAEILKGHTINKGQVIEFKAKLSMVPDFYLVGKGVIRWTKENIFSVGAGVEFIQLDAEAEDMINAYVQLFKVKSFVPGKSTY